MIDLRQYLLVKSDRSRCPDCQQYVYLLSPRDDYATPVPTFFLCRCGRISQAGDPEPVAESMRPGWPQPRQPSASDLYGPLRYPTHSPRSDEMP